MSLIWITNCPPDTGFEYLVDYCNKNPENDYMIGPPVGMDYHPSDEFWTVGVGMPMWTGKGVSPPLRPPTTAALIMLGYVGIYLVDDIKSHESIGVYNQV